MPYIDDTGLRERFGTVEIDELIGADASADPPEAGDVDKLTRACADATTLIDGYMAARYRLPLVTVPDLVVAWAADIARFKLWDDRAPEEVRKRYDDVLEQLRDLSKGRISLPPDAQGEPAADTADVYDGFSNERVFTACSLSGY